ncbi:putative F-box/LRR-repeat protein At3g18150 [Morus notabilis]|uniref:putative F-box/LRR-repeat protein At3g18150 n=1 Tax=Morus notabilis TaxID=981085 RepID=UPI000CED5F30|nr:putative F-box/LRR-repeat protein At3g18150 [Morus notabilis]
MDDEIDDIDRVSGLPDFLLHRILSFLPRKDANQTCVLSKRWNYIWDTSPVFDFDQDIYIPDPIAFTPKYRKQAREFINFVDKSLQRFSCCNLLMEKLELRMRLIERNHFPMIDQWLALFLNLDSGVQEMRLMVKTGYSDYDDDDGIYTLPKTTFVAKSISGPSKLDRLQKLSLEFVNISESVIQNIDRNCHNLNYLYLQNICGLKTLQISKLNKLETVTIVSTGYLRDLESVNIDAPNLKYFRIDANGPKCCISLNSCYNLKELRLSGCGITDDLLHWYPSRFPFIEVLEISNCSLLRKFEISAQRLKRLRLFFGCLGVERIQVNAPTLSIFECMTFNKPVLIPENVPCLMKIVYAMHRVADSSWFSELRKSLGHLPQRKLFTVEIHPCKASTYASLSLFSNIYACL